MHVPVCVCVSVMKTLHLPDDRKLISVTTYRVTISYRYRHFCGRFYANKWQDTLTLCMCMNLYMYVPVSVLVYLCCMCGNNSLTWHSHVVVNDG